MQSWGPVEETAPDEGASMNSSSKKAFTIYAVWGWVAPVEDIDKARDSEQESHSADKDAACQHMCQRDALIRDGHCRNSLHGLHWHGDAKGKP